MWAGYRSARNVAPDDGGGNRDDFGTGSENKTRVLWTDRHRMHTLIALLLAAAVACTIARPPGKLIT